MRACVCDLGRLIAVKQFKMNEGVSGCYIDEWLSRVSKACRNVD